MCLTEMIGTTLMKPNNYINYQVSNNLQLQLLAMNLMILFQLSYQSYYFRNSPCWLPYYYYYSVTSRICTIKYIYTCMQVWHLVKTKQLPTKSSSVSVPSIRNPQSTMLRISHYHQLLMDRETLKKQLSEV